MRVGAKSATGLLVLLLLGGIASGCVARARVYGGAGTIVYTQPPPPRVVVRTAAPAPGYVWAEGYWDWNGVDWVWIDGRWIAPRVGYIYEGPRWQHQGRGWVHVQGGWRPHRGGGSVGARPVPGPQQRPGVEVRGRPGVEVRGRGAVEVR